MNYQKCPDCNTLNEIGKQECKNCGYLFADDECKTSCLRCPECNREVKSGYEDCPFCGYPLDKLLEEVTAELEKTAQLVEEKAKEAEQVAFVNERIRNNQIVREENRMRAEDAKNRIELANQKIKQANEVQTINQGLENNNGSFIKNVIKSVSFRIGTYICNIFKLFLPISLKKKKISLFVIAAFVVVAAITTFTVFGSVQSVNILSDVYTIDLGTSGSIDVNVEPQKNGDVHLSWKSSDTSVVSVDKDGLLYANGLGSCTITVSSRNGKKDTCTVIVKKPGPDFSSVYKKLNDTFYCSLASDGSCLVIDTNPLNSKYQYDKSTGLSLIIQANSLLDLPDSLLNKMAQTRAIDGRQSEKYETITVSWTYHPDNGLEVLYESNN